MYNCTIFYGMFVDLEKKETLRFIYLNRVECKKSTVLSKL